MTGFMTYAEQHTIGVILLACALASILLCVCACIVGGRADARAEKQRHADVAAVHRRAEASGFTGRREEDQLYDQNHASDWRAWFDEVQS